jgi:predicted Zn-dependent peptidase
LNNGIVVYLLEDHELPIIDILAWIRTGAIYEPADKVGLASITGAVMRTGGTTSKTGDELDEILESLAASVEVEIGEDSGSASMSVLKEDLDAGLFILADVLMNPAFREDKIELEKVQRRSAIARRNDDPEEITDREFGKLIYGADSPYARTTEYETIDNITRDDLIAFHKKYFRPDNVILGVIGDFDSEAILEKIKVAFKDWQPAEMSFPPKPEIPDKPARKVGVVRKEDVNQTNIRMGHIGWLRSNADYPALVVMAQILGVGFSSRLVSSVRVEKGLAYAVGNNYGAGYDVPGLFLIACGTKSESTVIAIETILQEVERIGQTEVTDEELKRAIDGFMNSSVFDYDTRDEILARALRYEYYNYPQDFIEQLMEGIRKVTKADVLRVARKYLRPDEFTIVVVGRPEDFDKPLDTLGSVAEVDITIPLPSTSEPAPEASEGDIAKAKEILSEVIEAYGGLQKLKAVRNLAAKGAVTAAQTPMGPLAMEMTQYSVFPDKTRIVMQVPQLGELSYVYDGQSAWMSAEHALAQQIQPLNAVQAEEFRKSAYRDTIVLLPKLAEGDTPVQYVGAAEVNGKPADVIRVTQPNGEPLKLFIDPKTRYIVKKEYRIVGEEGPVAEEEFTDDYREVAGVRIGFHITTYRNGELYSEVQVTEAMINTEIDASMFEK